MSLLPNTEESLPCTICYADLDLPCACPKNFTNRNEDQMYVLSFDGQSHRTTSRGARAIVAAFEVHSIPITVTRSDDACCRSCYPLPPAPLTKTDQHLMSLISTEESSFCIICDAADPCNACENLMSLLPNTNTLPLTQRNTMNDLPLTDADDSTEDRYFTAALTVAAFADDGTEHPLQTISAALAAIATKTGADTLTIAYGAGFDPEVGAQEPVVIITYGSTSSTVLCHAVAAARTLAQDQFGQRGVGLFVSDNSYANGGDPADVISDTVTRVHQVCEPW